MAGERHAGRWCAGDWVAGDWVGGDWIAGDWVADDRVGGDWVSDRLVQPATVLRWRVAPARTATIVASGTREKTGRTPDGALPGDGVVGNEMSPSLNRSEGDTVWRGWDRGQKIS